MLVEDQSEVIAFLADPANWPDAAVVERIDTHCAAVFLGGNRALKLKRAVRFDYLDYSTAKRRRAMCEEEVRLNRRTAPRLYRGVRAVTRRAGGGLELDGPGVAVDWLVEMDRFDQDTLFDRLVQAGCLTPELVTGLADSIARFHDEAEVRRDMGGPDDVLATIQVNYWQCLRFIGTVFEREPVEELERLLLAAFDRGRELIGERVGQGLIRHCHGDLHLRNICLYEGRPTLFDAIEFNERFAVTDVLYDLAFLVMDLLHRGRRDLANGLLNRYVVRRWDIAGFGLLPLYLAMRASVRAHVSATMAETADDPVQVDRLHAEARDYLRQSAAYLQPPPPALVAVGGLSGTGKSTLARVLAPDFGPAPGALVLRSDVIRKLLRGHEPEQPLEPEAYTPEVSRNVYARIREGAALALAAGHGVVADAVFARPGERRDIAEVAARARCRFAGLWLEAPEAVLERRVDSRTGDASDADARVVRQQLAYDPGPMEWARIDAGGEPAEVAARARRALRRKGLAPDPPPKGGATGQGKAYDAGARAPRGAGQQVQRDSPESGPMTIKNILVPLSGAKRDSDAQEMVLRVAISAALRHGAHVEALHVAADPRDAVVFVGEGMTSTMIEGIITAAEQEARERSTLVRELFARVTGDLNVPVSRPDAMPCEFSATLTERIGREEEMVACRGRVSDMIVVARPSSDEEANAPLTLEAALRETGRPVVVVPPGTEGKFGGPISVAIAWNGSVEASRAVAFALSYLAAAESVTVLSVDEGRATGPSGEELVTYLACHGIAATSRILKDAGGRGAGQALLAEVAAVGADMMVMGAYSRSRMRRLIFGGATSEVLNKTEIPILMVH